MSYGVRERLLDGERSSVQYAVLAAVLVAAPFLVGPFETRLLTEVLIFAVFATAFNLLYGYTGLLSFGHAMFVAAAGYTLAQFVKNGSSALGFPDLFGGASVLVTFVVAVVLAVLVATLLAVVVGYLSVQLQEIYFAMITLSFSMAVFVVANQNIGGLTNGSDGLSFILGRVDLFGVEFTLMNIRDPIVYYFVVLAVFAAAMYALWRVVNSPFGMICTAIRENPERAEALGINETFHSWMTFIVSGAFSGLAGALLVPLRTGITPDLAYWSFSAEPVIMTVIGGPYSFAGPAVGAFVYEYLREFINSYPTLANRWQFAFGFVLLLVVLFFDNGVAGGIERLRAWLGETGEHYREGGFAAVVSFARASVVRRVASARDAVTGRPAGRERERKPSDD
ncbi:branched-chain amino acid ABC transporter permease [Halomarina pelagica]|uniref:branched-chain amino acid ABC transporter permease n=1 Tax=Halomarina pelagica TaxID=2961599 RepID=UPI0020C364FE|nr:branched-chain amino acid ABC transporter permease [Halomarina sp. BND7]